MGWSDGLTRPPLSVRGDSRSIRWDLTTPAGASGVALERAEDRGAGDRAVFVDVRLKLGFTPFAHSRILGTGRPNRRVVHRHTARERFRRHLVMVVSGVRGIEAGSLLSKRDVKLIQCRTSSGNDGLKRPAVC